MAGYTIVSMFRGDDAAGHVAEELARANITVQDREIIGARHAGTGAGTAEADDITSRLTRRQVPEEDARNYARTAEHGYALLVGHPPAHSLKRPGTSRWTG